MKRLSADCHVGAVVQAVAAQGAAYGGEMQAELVSPACYGSGKHGASAALAVRIQYGMRYLHNLYARWHRPELALEYRNKLLSPNHNGFLP